MSDCPRCGDRQWTCEAHPDQPFEHDDCPGPGDPCPVCNPMSRDFFTTPYPPEMQRRLMKEIYERVNGVS